MKPAFSRLLVRLEPLGLMVPDDHSYASQPVIETAAMRGSTIDTGAGNVDALEWVELWVGRLRGFYDRLVSLEWEQTIVDSRDPGSLGRWWREALNWVVVNDDPDEFEIRPSADRLPGLLFVPVPESKTIKNRLHLDFRPDDRDVEVERLLALGATRADLGQGEQSWIVLADPEGNEFCVLGSRSP